MQPRTRSAAANGVALTQRCTRAAAQVSWEKERKYQPVMPVLAVGNPDEVAV